MSERMTDERLAEIELEIEFVDIGHALVDLNVEQELLQALETEREYSGSADLLLDGAKHRIAELEKAHDKIITDGIEIVEGRDARIEELEAALEQGDSG